MDTPAKFISSDNIPLLEGGMSALSFVCEQLHEQQVPDVTKVLFPRLHQVLSAKGVHWAVQRDAIKVFKSLAYTLVLKACNEENEAVEAEILKPALTRWLAVLAEMLSDSSG